MQQLDFGYVLFLFISYRFISDLHIALDLLNEKYR